MSRLFYCSKKSDLVWICFCGKVSPIEVLSSFLGEIMLGQVRFCIRVGRDFSWSGQAVCPILEEKREGSGERPDLVVLISFVLGFESGVLRVPFLVTVIYLASLRERFIPGSRLHLRRSRVGI
jgi:hypothetical protein